MGIDSFALDRYDACVFDLDGTVWIGGGERIPGAVEFLDRCRDLDIAIVYATNATAQTPEAVSRRLVDAGIARPDEPVITSGLVMARSLRRRGVTHAAALAPDGLRELLEAAGIEIVSPEDHDVESFGPVDDCRALVMAASRTVTFGAIERLGRLAVAGHPTYISSKDAGFRIAGGIQPGGGALVAALTAMYDVEVTVLGKPSPDYAAVVADAIGDRDRRVAVFGDSQRSDIGIAHHLGADGVLLTEHAVVPIATDLPAPTYIGTSLAHELLPFG